MYLLHGLVGNAVFAGVSVLLVTGPVTAVACVYFNKFGNAGMKFKDRRVEVINEILNAIKVSEIQGYMILYEFIKPSEPFVL